MSEFNLHKNLSLREAMSIATKLGAKVIDADDYIITFPGQPSYRCSKNRHDAGQTMLKWLRKIEGIANTARQHGGDSADDATSLVKMYRGDVEAILHNCIKVPRIAEEVAANLKCSLTHANALIRSLRIAGLIVPAGKAHSDKPGVRPMTYRTSKAGLDFLDLSDEVIADLFTMGNEELSGALNEAMIEEEIAAIVAEIPSHPPEPEIAPRPPAPDPLTIIPSEPVQLFPAAGERTLSERLEELIAGMQCLLSDVQQLELENQGASAKVAEAEAKLADVTRRNDEIAAAAALLQEVLK